MPPNPDNATLDGWLTWSLIDRKGQTIEEHRQHNLFLNQGLDLIATYGFDGTPNYAIVSTDATAPAVTDTTIANEVGRTNNNAGISTTLNWIADGLYQIVITREFDYGEANGNLTKWGFSPVSANNVAVSELFRDGGGTAKTVTKTLNYKLRLIYSLRVQLGPTVSQSFTFNISGIGNVNAKRVLMKQTLSPVARDNLDWNALNRWAMGLSLLWQHKARSAVDPPLYGSDSIEGIGGGTPLGSITPNAYVTGQYKRNLTLNASPTQLNSEWAGFCVCDNVTVYGNAVPGLYIRFNDDQHQVVKASTNNLTFSGLEFAWGRA